MEESTSDIAAQPAPSKDPFEKGIFGSKKFKLATFFIVACLALAAGLAYLKAGQWPIVTAIVTSGFVAVGTIGGQAWMERYTRVAFFEGGKRG